MSLTAAERLTFGIECPRCGKVTEKRVAWLATNSRMRCATPNCGAIIGLDAPKNRTVIDKLVDQASELDALMLQLKEDN
jgi:hypothetical protein